MENNSVLSEDNPLTKVKNDGDYFEKRTKKYWVDYLNRLEAYQDETYFESRREEIEAKNYIELIKMCIDNNQWIGPEDNSSTDYTLVKRVVQVRWMNTEDITYLWTYGGLFVEVEGYFISRDTFKEKVIMSEDGITYKQFNITLPPEATNVVLPVMGGCFVPIHSPVADRLKFKHSKYFDITI